MSENRLRVEQARLRELARQTLEAFRKLNSAAAAASHPDARKANGSAVTGADGVTGAIELLEGVLAEMKRTKTGARS